MQVLDDNTRAYIAEWSAILLSGFVLDGQRMSPTIKRANIRHIALTQHELAAADVNVVQHHDIDSVVALAHQHTQLIPIIHVAQTESGGLNIAGVLVGVPTQLHLVLVVLAPVLSLNSSGRQYVRQCQLLQQHALAGTAQGAIAPAVGYRCTLHAIIDRLAFIHIGQRLVGVRETLLILLESELSDGRPPLVIILHGAFHVALDDPVVRLLYIRLRGIIHLPCQLHIAVGEQLGLHILRLVEVRHVVCRRFLSRHLVFLAVHIVHLHLQILDLLIRRNVDGTETLIRQRRTLCLAILLVGGNGSGHLTGGNLPHHTDFLRVT